MNKPTLDVEKNTLRCNNESRYNVIKKILKKVDKGGWRMPRLQEAKKDMISCDKLRGVANKL